MKLLGKVIEQITKNRIIWTQLLKTD
jgi:hypothetical protein